MTTTTNLLENGAFDNGAHYMLDRHGNPVGQVEIANGWLPWWDANDWRPEYVVDDRDAARRVKSGLFCQHWFNSYHTHTAGIMQRVVSDGAWGPGDELIASAYVQAWSREDFGTGDADRPDQSNGKYRMKIGIDPYGGIDPMSSDIVWSEAVQPYDEYVHVGVATGAQSNRATVFLWGQAEWNCKHNDAYTDDVQVVAVLSGNPPSPPVPPVPPIVSIDKLAQVIAEKTERNVMRAIGSALKVLSDIISEAYKE